MKTNTHSLTTVLLILSIMLLVASTYVLSLWLATKHYDDKAAEYATAMSGTADAGNATYQAYYDAYIDSNNNKALLGIVTVGQARKMSPTAGINIGMTLQITIPDTIAQSLTKEETALMVQNSYSVIENRINIIGASIGRSQVKRDGRIELEIYGAPSIYWLKKSMQPGSTLEFYETYRLLEIEAPLQQLAAEIAGGDTAAIATLLGWHRVYTHNDATIATARVADTAAVNSIFNSEAAKRLLPPDLKTCWTAHPALYEDSCLDLIALKGAPVLDGNVITDATNSYEQLAQSDVVSLSMDNEGAKRWLRITKMNIGRQIAIVVDSKAYSVPYVNCPIEGGHAQISGLSPAEAAHLARTLKSGKLPANFRIEDIYFIGPTFWQKAAIPVMATISILLLAAVVALVYTLSRQPKGQRQPTAQMPPRR